MATPVKWTDELKDKVRGMWNDKRMSAAQIGAEFDVSRCAIISLIHRMGLDGFRGASADERATLRAVRLQRDRARQASKAARQVKGDVAPKLAKTKAPEARVIVPTIEMLNIPFSERRRNQCSWIPGEPGADAICCGLDVVDGKAWCAHHHAMIYVPRALRVVASNNRPNRTITRYGALRVA